MESKAEEYRRKADDAEKNGDETRDVADKTRWREIAEQWRTMAATADRQGRKRASEVQSFAEHKPYGD
jgi:rubredoxin